MLTSWNPLSHSRPVTGLIYLYLYLYSLLLPRIKTNLSRQKSRVTNVEIFAVFHKRQFSLSIPFSSYENFRVYFLFRDLSALYGRIYFNTETPQTISPVQNLFKTGPRYETEINLKCGMAVFTIWIIACGQTVINYV